MPDAQYQKDWRAAHPDKYAEYRKRWYEGHLDAAKASQAAFRAANPGYQREYQGLESFRALQVVQVGGLDKWTGREVPVCVRCGCSDSRALQVNHKNGGGRKTGEGEHGRALRAAIITGRRAVGDLEVLCRPCDAVHYLELKFPGFAGKLVVSWLSVAERSYREPRNLRVMSTTEQPAVSAAGRPTAAPAPAPAPTTAYCVKCKAKREIKDPKPITMKNGRAALKGACPVCGTSIMRIGG